MQPIIIFLGPSLSLIEAKAILPNAYYMSPIRCGDIIQIMRLNPRIIGIIDGYFENTAAVWHKEIIYALEKGIEVLGSSSMGALRASELAAFGMRPIGQIANNYLSGQLNDDEDVALLHTSATTNYCNITEAMVNIYATLKIAKKQGIINSSTNKQLLKLAKSLFYQERSLQTVITMARNEEICQEELDLLEAWLLKDNYCNLKKEDAILLLKTIADDTSLDLGSTDKNLHKHELKSNNRFVKKLADVGQQEGASTPTAHTSPIILNKGAFFRALHKNMMCRPFTYYYEFLPQTEKVAWAARYLGSNYRLVRRLAYLLAACHHLAMAKNIVASADQINHLFDGSNFSIKALCKTIEWDKNNDCEQVTKSAFLSRLAAIRVLIDQEHQLANTTVVSSEMYIIFMMSLSGEYAKYKKQLSPAISHHEPSKIRAAIIELFKATDPTRYHLMCCFAECWWLIEQQVFKCGLIPTTQTLLEYSNSLRQAHGLSTRDLTEQWLLEHDLDEKYYEYFVSANAKLSTIIIQNNLDILTIINDKEDTYWLLDALWLSGIYTDAKFILTNPEQIKELQLKAQKKENNLNKYALSLDFVGGEEDFMQEHGELS